MRKRRKAVARQIVLDRIVLNLEQVGGSRVDPSDSGYIFYMSRSYRNLVGWRKAKDLAVELYRVTEQFPKHELYGLTSQLRRAGVSVASNIAEGQGRPTRADFMRFLGNSKGSVLEIDTQLTIAAELRYLSAADYRRLSSAGEEIAFLLDRLTESLRQPTS